MTSKKIVKALSKLDAYIDNDRQELSDMLEDVKLSHKRQEKLLKNIVMSIKANDDQISKEYSYFLINLINRELNNPLYRCRERKKGGKRCV